jgi:hypothetical protein
VSIVTASRADTITLYQDTSRFSYSDGGEFGAVVGAGSGGPIPYAASSAAQVAGYNFQTFCVQSTVTFNPGVQYYSGEALNDGSGRALSWGAAWLYDQFWNGLFSQPSQYNYSLGVNRENAAGALQYAIWEFQGQSIGSWGQSVAGTALYNAAVTALTGMGKTATSAYDGSAFASGKSVRILVLTDQPNGQGNAHQNQLVEIDTPTGVPLPSTACAGAVLLGCLGIFGKFRSLHVA